MKTFIADIIPKIKQYSQKLDNLTLLTNQHWVVVDEIQDRKSVYIFRDNNQLLISNNGKVEKASWEYLGNDSILIERKDDAFLLKHGFFDENVLALKIDSQEGYVILANETRFKKEINSVREVIEFLELTYFSSPFLKQYNKHVDYEQSNKEKTQTNFGEFEKGVRSGVEAFCLGCRQVDISDNLYYCATSDLYFHQECLLEHIKKNK